MVREVIQLPWQDRVVCLKEKTREGKSRETKCSQVEKQRDLPLVAGITGDRQEGKILGWSEHNESEVVV